MGDNPTSGQSVPGLLDLSTQSILLGVAQIPNLSSLYAGVVGSQSILSYDDTNASVSNSTTETTFTQPSVTANILGTTGCFRIVLAISVANSTGSAQTVTINFYHNSTIIGTDTISVPNASSVQYVEFFMKLHGTTTANRNLLKTFKQLAGTSDFGSAGANALVATTQFSVSVHSAIDFSALVQPKITVTLGLASANLSANAKWAFLEIFRPNP